jgi:hypothetical protein
MIAAKANSQPKSAMVTGPGSGTNIIAGSTINPPMIDDAIVTSHAPAPAR